MSLAHECVRECTKENQYFYRGPSPDEVTLVEFAKDLGFTFLSETDHSLSLEVRMPGQEQQNTLAYKLFRKVEFNSDRKRMSILVQDPIDQKVKLYVKGADSIILERLAP